MRHRHNTNGIVPITERGPGVLAVIPALSRCSSADVRIELWVDNLCSSAEKLYVEAGKEVSLVRLLRRQKATHELQLPEILVDPVLATGKKRKLSPPAEVIDITGQDTEDEGMPVSSKCFLENRH